MKLRTVFFASALVIAASSVGVLGGFVYAEDNNAFTSYETISEVLFSPAKLQRQHLVPTAEQTAVIEATRRAVLQLIDGAAVTWHQAIAAPEPATASQWRVVREAMASAPVWICPGRCPLCSAQSAGCALTRQTGDTVASAIFVSGCFFDSAYCKGVSDKGQIRIGTLFKQMSMGLGYVAYSMIHGTTESSREQASKQVSKAVALLGASFATMNGLLADCPGPFSQTGFSFLKSTRHLTEIGNLSQACATQLLAPLATRVLPPVCKAVLDEKKWSKEIQKGLLWDQPTPMRCDSLCELVTCGQKDSVVPRVIQFGSKRVLSIPEGACEGSRPNDVRSFVETVVRKNARPGQSALVELCARRLVPNSPIPPGPATNSTLNGPDVELIQ